MFSNNNRISLRQLKRLIILDMFSISCILIVPVATRFGNTDGIFLILISAIIAFLYGLFMIYIFHHIGEDFFDYAKKCVGKIGSFVIAVFYILKLLYSLIILSSYFSTIIQRTLLVDTSHKIILAAIIFIGAYEGYLGMEERGRIAELLFWIVLIPFSIFLFQGLFKIDITNLTPLLVSDSQHIFKGSYGVFCIYAVIELLIFTLPYVRKGEISELPATQRKRERKSFTSAILITCIFQILLFIVTVGTLGVDESKQTLWSTVISMGIVDLPGNVVRRQDAFLIGFWIFSAFVLLGTLIFYLSYTVKKAFNGKKHFHYIVPLSIFAFLGAAACIDLEANFTYYGRYMQYIGIPQSILIPIILILINKWKRRKHHE